MSLKEKLSLTTIMATIPELASVESLVSSKFASDSKLLREIPAYLFDLGGKRIRPLLALLVGKALKIPSPLPQSLIEISAGIELIHLATLLHDDIIDKSQKRRNATSPFVVFGTNNTLLAGDFLLVRAFSLCAHLDKYIVDRTERACIELTEGEIDEIPLSEYRTNINGSIEIARKKTAALFRLACESAAFISNAPKNQADALQTFGESLGIAFQMLDDVLDITSSDEVLGKPIGTDIREKKPSIVNILWLESKDPASQILLKDDEPNPEEVKKAVAALRKSPVIQHARDMALSFVAKAHESLMHGIPNKSLERDYLESISKIVVERLS